MNPLSSFITSGDTQLHYEIAGAGPPLVFIHAGVADGRQWNNEFRAFANHYCVLRYDMRGFGRSEPVAGDYRHSDDLHTLLGALAITEPAVLVGCSIGGGLALDFALDHPESVRALVMVSSAPSGLQLDVNPHPLEAAVMAADEAGDSALLLDLETRMWFDGIGRAPEDIDQEMRQLAIEMNRIALANEARNLGNRLPNAATPAAERLGDLAIPVLIIAGANDEPYTLAAADHMVKHLANARKVIFDNAAHLLNMDQPALFERTLRSFLESL